MAPGMAGQAGHVPASHLYGRERAPRPSASPRPAASPPLSPSLFPAGGCAQPLWGPARRPRPPLRGVVAGRPLPSPSPRGSRWPGAGLWRRATIPPCSCLRRLRQAQVRGPWPRSGRRPAHLRLLFVVRRRPDACFLPSVVRRRPGLSPFPQWPGAEAAARAVLTALAGHREEPVAGEPRPRKAVGAAAGQRVAARDPSPLLRQALGGRSSARSHGRSLPDRRLRFCEMTWPNEKPRNWPGIVGRDRCVYDTWILPQSLIVAYK